MLVHKSFVIKPIQKLSICRRVMNIRTIPKAVHSDAVLYDYVEAYSKYICSSKVKSCTEHMIIPLAEEQMRILHEMYDITKRVNCNGVEGTFLKLLIMHDYDTVENLIKHLNMYNELGKLINTIVRYTYNIPIDIQNINI